MKSGFSSVLSAVLSNDLRQQICVKGRAGIVIALKRNGAYAEHIQVQQLG